MKFLFFISYDFFHQLNQMHTTNIFEHKISFTSHSKSFLISKQKRMRTTAHTQCDDQIYENKVNETLSEL